MKRTEASKQIMLRFYSALDTLIAQGNLRGVKTYCDRYNIDRRNMQNQRKNLDRGWFQLSWLQPMVLDFNISSLWLLTGKGRMFVIKKEDI